MNVDKLLVEAGAYFGGDGINYERFKPRKFASLVLATTQPQRTWVDLTDEEIDNINYTSAHMLAREVLAKFKEKNT